ncbi:hypothetical protein ACFVU2_21045 [Leifsonia sp. NPDC058194]|uniref:hypothetical protein n=1 Tax=Leifsonia sp. NPDC058194 TaxID=3346374 RepID=UPI0036DAB4E1
MSIVDGKGLITWEGGEFAPGSDLLRRLQWAFPQIRAAGGRISLTEAGRPFGVPSDANVRNAWQTASGVSTVWFQWGRFLRGETPSAADPRSGNTMASEHTQGIAADCYCPTVFDEMLRAKFFAMVGLKQTISSESWHWAIRGPSLVDLTSSAGVGSVTHLTPAASVAKPILEDIMAVRATRTSTDQTYLIGQGFIKHLPDQNYKDGTVQFGPISELADPQFHALCEANGIPWNIVPWLGAGNGWDYNRVVQPPARPGTPGYMDNMRTGAFSEPW